jgi:hypothetical protein
MSLKRLKYIENENIPWALTLKEEPEFYIHKIEKIDDNIILHYFVEDKGISINMDDYNKFQELPEKIEMISGGWYDDNGRWSPFTRYSGTIICENAIGMKKLSEKGENYKFRIRKAFLSSYKTLTIESDKVGIIEIKCKRIKPQKHETLLFSKIENEWKPRGEFIF